MVGYSRAYAEAFAQAPKRKRGRPRKAVAAPKSPYQLQMDEMKARIQAQPSKRAAIACPMVMSDIVPFRSPIDGADISSRSKLKAHEQRHGVKQNGDFKKGEIIAKENRRVEESLKGAEMETASWE